MNALEDLFAAHYLSAVAKLNAACKPYDCQRAALRAKAIRQATDRTETAYPIGLSERHPPLWEVDGDPQ